MRHVIKICWALALSLTALAPAARADDYQLSHNQRISCSRGLAPGKLNTATCKSYTYLFNAKTSEYFRCQVSLALTRENVWLDLAGLPPFLRDATASAARERSSEYPHVVTLSRSLIEPFLVFSTRRDLRERAYAAWVRRGETGGETDNRAIIAEIVRLRAERARLLGFESFAHYKLDDTMAGSPDAAMDLLRDVWAPALRRARTTDRPMSRACGRKRARGCSGLPPPVMTRSRSSTRR